MKTGVKHVVRKGLTIALIGFDGTGKTTAGKALMKSLVTSGYNVTFRHEFDYFLFKYFFKMANKFSQEKTTRTRQAGLRNKELYRIWLYLVLVDTIFEQLFVRLFRRNIITIFDRYLYDFLIQLDLMKGHDRFLSWSYLRFFKPDVVFALDIKPEIAFERKKADHTYTISFYGEMRKRYAKMASLVGARVVSTETSVQNTVNTMRSQLRISEDVE